MKRSCSRLIATLMTFVLLVSQPANIRVWAAEDEVNEPEEIRSDESVDDIAVEEAGSSTSGTCGENLTWELDDEGVLTISGTGEMDPSDDDVLWEEEKVKHVIIQNGVTSIGESAFEDCSDLTSITLPEGLIDIDEEAFAGCSSLTSIALPNSLTYISDFAFEGCSSLTSIALPNSLVNVGYSVFSLCSSLTSITIPDTNPYYTSVDGVLYDKDQKYLICCPGGREGDYTIPNTVTEIAAKAFDGCSGLTSITISNSVTSLGSWVFCDCSGLTSVIIPDSVKSIGYTAFGGCSGLTSITLSENLNSIDDSAFTYCSGLTSITIPNSVKSIGKFAFSCCSGLTSIVLPNSLTSIGDSAFAGCSNLTTITMPETNTKYASEEGVLFNKEKTNLICCPNGKVGEYTIPNSVISISGSGFSGCSGLTSITIPNSVKSIEGGGFGECSGLTSITIPNSVTSIGQFVFDQCSNLTSITIPDGLSTIRYCTFQSCESLTSVVLPVSVTNIEGWAFNNCHNIKDIYYSGTKEDWDKITIEETQNFYFKLANVHYECVPGVSVNEISLSHTSLTLKVGEDGTLTATALPKNAYNKALTWSSSAPDIATVTDGKVSAVAPGEAVITVKAVDGGKSASCNVTVTEKEIIKLTGITLDKAEAVLAEGEKLALKVSFIPADATNKNVTWSSSDENVAKVAAGEVTAIKVGKAVITAVAEDGGYEAKCEITVKEKEADSDPEEPTIDDPDPTPVSESPLGPDKPDLSQYTASGNEIAVKSINLKKSVFSGVKGIKKFDVTSGDATAVKIKGSTLTVLKNGSVTIAAFDKKSEKLAEKTINLIAPVIETAQPTEINRRGNLDLNKYITSTVKPSGWKSSSKKIAEVNSDGLLTMKKSGTVKITVTFPSEKGMTAKKLTFKLKIAMPQFKKNTYTVKAGKTIATAVKNAVASDITYRIEDQNVATVDAAGKVTGVSKGTTKLIMTVKGIDYETKIKVK